MYIFALITNLIYRKMIRKMTTALIAITAIGTFAFTTINTKPADYTVNAKMSTCTWLAKKVTGEHTGGIKISKGSIISDGKTITGGSFEFDMRSITNTDLTDSTYNAKLITHLKSDDFFSTEKNPTAKFELKKIELKSGSEYSVTGNLTIKGITNEISFPAVINIKAKTIVTVAKITVNRTKFDIKYGSASFFEGLADKAISDEFELNINVVATRQ